MRTLDQPTMALLSLCISLATAVLMAVIWRANAKTSGPFFWLMGSVLAPVALWAAITLRRLPEESSSGAWSPGIWGMVYASSLSLIFLAALEGLLRFFAIGNPERRRYVMLSAAGGLLMLGPLIAPLPEAWRMMVQDGVLLLLLLASVAVLLRGARDVGVVIRLFAATAFTLLVACLSWRIGNTLDVIDGVPGVSLRRLDGTMMFLLTVWTFWWTYGVMLMVLKRSQARIEALGREDALTGLPNRREFDRVFEETVRVMQKTGAGFAVATFDLDGFKEINDGIGHVAGDSCLIEVANRLRRCCRGGDLPARFGGDEFVVLLRGVTDEDALSAALVRLTEEVEGVLTVRGQDQMIRLSVGGALVPRDGENQTDVLHVADQRMYAVKQARRARGWPRGAGVAETVATA